MSLLVGLIAAIVARRLPPLSAFSLGDALQRLCFQNEPASSLFRIHY